MVAILPVPLKTSLGKYQIQLALANQCKCYRPRLAGEGGHPCELEYKGQFQG